MHARHLISLPLCYTDPATTEIYTLSLHDALPIWSREALGGAAEGEPSQPSAGAAVAPPRNRSMNETQTLLLRDRKSTRLNSSHLGISYAVFCLKKKKTYMSIIATQTISNRDRV